MADRISRLVVIGLLAALVALVAWRLGRTSGGGDAPDWYEAASAVLEQVHEEGYLDPQVDYEDPVLRERKVFLLKDVDGRAVVEVMKKLLFLDRLEPGRPIDLFIDSGGGAYGDTLPAFFRTLSSPVNTWCLGSCYSAAAKVLAGGTGRRRAFESSQISIHFVEAYDHSDEDPEFSSQALDRKARGAFWPAVSRLPDRFFEVEGSGRFYLSARQALEFGLVDEVVPIRAE